MNNDYNDAKEFKYLTILGIIVFISILILEKLN